MASSWIEISQGALLNNLGLLKQIAGPTALGIVVKSNAYGHGMLEIAHLLKNNPDVSWLCTATIDEAVALREAGWHKNILVLSYTQDFYAQEAIQYRLDLMVDSLETAHILNVAAQKLSLPANVHIKIDTSLSRRGIPIHAFQPFLETLTSRCPFLTVRALFTHSADTRKNTITSFIHDLEIFRELCKKTKNIPHAHALASGALALLYAEYKKNGSPAYLDHQYSLARIGSHAYGLWKSHEQQQYLQAQDPSFLLQPVLTWKTRIAEIYTVEGSDLPLYHLPTRTTDRARIAVIPVGYADGYCHALASKSSLLILNQYAPVGIVHMHYLVVDITDIPEATTGCVATLLGTQPAIQASTLAPVANTINNALLASLPSIIKRFVVD